jgi:hypothetical protein
MSEQEVRSPPTTPPRGRAVTKNATNFIIFFFIIYNIISIVACPLFPPPGGGPGNGLFTG